MARCLPRPALHLARLQNVSKNSLLLCRARRRGLRSEEEASLQPHIEQNLVGAAAPAGAARGHRRRAGQGWPHLPSHGSHLFFLGKKKKAFSLLNSVVCHAARRAVCGENDCPQRREGRTVWQKRKCWGVKAKEKEEGEAAARTPGVPDRLRVSWAAQPRHQLPFCEGRQLFPLQPHRELGAASGFTWGCFTPWHLRRARAVPRAGKTQQILAKAKDIASFSISSSQTLTVGWKRDALPLYESSLHSHKAPSPLSPCRSLPELSGPPTPGPRFAQ